MCHYLQVVYVSVNLASAGWSGNIPTLFVFISVNNISRGGWSLSALQKYRSSS